MMRHNHHGSKKESKEGSSKERKKEGYKKATIVRKKIVRKTPSNRGFSIGCFCK
jgi:hypothetical protein